MILQRGLLAQCRILFRICFESELEARCEAAKHIRLSIIRRSAAFAASPAAIWHVRFSHRLFIPARWGRGYPGKEKGGCLP
jgi:hypothetical protein